MPTPEVFLYPPEDEGVYPILARLVNHRGGMDIRWCNNYDEAVANELRFFTRYTPVHREYRVHVFDGMVLRTFRKVAKEDGADDKIRTSYRGWGYKRVRRSNVNERGIEVSLSAVSSLGLNFGAVDLGVNDETGNVVVFEVNTGPSLNSVSLLYYAQEFERYLLQLEGVTYEPTGVCWSDEIDRRTKGDG